MVLTPDDYKTEKFKRTRVMYIAECAIEYFIYLLLGNEFLAKILSDIGTSDAITGIISSITSFGFLFQLLTVFFEDKIKNVKKTAIILDSLAHLFFMMVYLVPFLKIPIMWKTILVVSGIFMAHMVKNFISSLKCKWGMAFIIPSKLGIYSALRDTVSLVSGALFCLVVGYMIEIYEKSGNLHGGFLSAAVIILVLNILNVLSLAFMSSEQKQETDTDTVKSKISLKTVFVEVIKNKRFIDVVVLSVCFQIAHYFTYGFLGIYKIRNLELSLGTIQMINLVGNTARILFQIPLGMYADKKTFAKVIELSMGVAAVAMTLNVFTVKSTWYLIIIFQTLYNIALGGIEANLVNMAYRTVREEYIVQALCIRACIAGLMGFAASLAGGAILFKIQNNANSVFGFSIYAQQLMSAISAVIMILGIFYNKLVIQRHKEFSTNNKNINKIS